MHPLLSFPCEIHDIIFTRLSQSTLAQLCLVNQQSYDLCLPHLYRHVHIKIRKQLIQLDNGLKRSFRLKEVVRIHTKRLTLTSCQSSYQWLISETQAEWCQRWMPHLVALTFCDFAILPVERVVPFLALPLETLHFRYCNLVCHNQPEAYIPMLPEELFYTSIYQLPATYSYHTKHTSDNNDDETVKAQPPVSAPLARPSTSLTHLLLDWTDFSPTAIDSLLGMVPRLTHISLGANHNRIKDANTSALDSLQRTCPQIRSLKLALQQIHPSSLCQLIQHYGIQLRHLDIQCHHTNTLITVAQHAVKVEQLVIHAVGPFTNVKSSSSTVSKGGIEGIVQQCGNLIHMEMVSWGIRDIPAVILKAMAQRRKQQRLQASLLLASSWSEKASLVLNGEILDELRSLFA